MSRVIEGRNIRSGCTGFRGRGGRGARTLVSTEIQKLYNVTDLGGFSCASDGCNEDMMGRKMGRRSFTLRPALSDNMGAKVLVFELPLGTS